MFTSLQLLLFTHVKFTLSFCLGISPPLVVSLPTLIFLVIFCLFFFLLMISQLTLSLAKCRLCLDLLVVLPQGLLTQLWKYKINHHTILQNSSCFTVAVFSHLGEVSEQLINPFICSDPGAETLAYNSTHQLSSQPTLSL